MKPLFHGKFFFISAHSEAGKQMSVTLPLGCVYQVNIHTAAAHRASRYLQFRLSVAVLLPCGTLG